MMGMMRICGMSAVDRVDLLEDAAGDLDGIGAGLLVDRERMPGSPLTRTMRRTFCQVSSTEAIS